MASKKNGNRKKADLNLMAYQISEIHTILKGDTNEPGLVKRVGVLEKTYIRITGIAAGVGFACSLAWTAISHVWRAGK